MASGINFSVFCYSWFWYHLPSQIKRTQPSYVFHSLYLLSIDFGIAQRPAQASQKLNSLLPPELPVCRNKTFSSARPSIWIFINTYNVNRNNDSLTYFTLKQHKSQVFFVYIPLFITFKRYLLQLNIKYWSRAPKRRRASSIVDLIIFSSKIKKFLIWITQ